MLAALAWLENEYKLPLVVAGFSFGASWRLRRVAEAAALRALTDVRTLVALGLPVRSGPRPCAAYRLFLPCTTARFPSFS